MANPLPAREGGATPNPGSDEAIERGCTCPVIDNHYGKGVPYRGKREFWISGGCPLHGATEAPAAVPGRAHDR